LEGWRKGEEGFVLGCASKVFQTTENHGCYRKTQVNACLQRDLLRGKNRAYSEIGKKQREYPNVLSWFMFPEVSLLKILIEPFGKGL